jgi:hypothetical protein
MSASLSSADAKPTETILRGLESEFRRSTMASRNVPTSSARPAETAFSPKNKRASVSITFCALMLRLRATAPTSIP